MNEIRLAAESGQEAAELAERACEPHVAGQPERAELDGPHGPAAGLVSERVLMPDSPSAAPAPVHRSLSVEQPEWSGPLARQASAAPLSSAAPSGSSAARARQHALVFAWLRELTRKKS